ncbi:MAG: 16S rRNA (guanine(966)-N(2))-methyltransferase RsmD [Proteobacteria bacterium]|nr:16S rRNA (guanine(966)-N(2))-methyltransferase RsmD [Pseudomonadota bacterium]MDA1355540.1 16S rRNA (guanine(966)-N(2))-methyltransferase RsmD [Pseudomonadota bacterium]
MRIVGGSRRGRRLKTPEGRALRPTSERAREALFNILGHRDFAAPPLKGARVIDLFAGTGAVGLEALSRGAAHLTAVESDGVALACLRENVQALDFHSKARVIHGDATSLPPAPEPCAYAFLDPPYRGGKAEPALLSLAKSNWLVDGAIVVAETSAKEVLAAPDGYQEIDRRRYGAAEIVILQYRPLPAAE